MNHYRNFLVMIVMAAMVILSACAPSNQMPTTLLPAGQAYANGKEIYFIHTETSDETLSGLLSKMMDSPVLYVPALKNVPQDALAQVYVFENGIKGSGPLGFQADVFDNPPGSAGYSPLRMVNLVKWNEPSKAKLLMSDQAILDAIKSGEVFVNRSGAVVNMPFVVWEGGKR